MPHEVWCLAGGGDLSGCFAGLGNGSSLLSWMQEGKWEDRMCRFVITPLPPWVENFSRERVVCPWVPHVF